MKQTFQALAKEEDDFWREERINPIIGKIYS